MKRLLTLSALLMIIGFQVSWATDYDYSGEKWVPGNLIVNFKPEVGTLQDADGGNQPLTFGVPEVDELLARYRVTRCYRLWNDWVLSRIKVVPDFYRLVVLECPQDTDILQMMHDFDACPYVDYSEPDLLRPLDDRVPNDPMWGQQWDKVLMNCPAAWDFSTGNQDLIAIAIDGGTYWRHADLYDNLWVNYGEDLNMDSLPYPPGSTYPGDSLNDVDYSDNDENGYVDDFIGWDFIRRPSGCDPTEDCDGEPDNNTYSIEDHGTHVIGLLGARGNNRVGVAGVNWNITVMCVRCGYRATDGQGYVVSTAAVSGMGWALAHGAMVYNMSYGSSQQNSAERNALQSLWDNGAVLCAAAGNNAVTQPHYPAAYPNVVAVGSVDSDDQVSDFSNRGTWVDCFAPGNMVTSLGNGGYQTYPGTSMASPNAAGIFALIWSIFPNMTNDEVENFVLDHAVDIRGRNPSINPSYLGRGRLDAGRVLASIYPQLTLYSPAVAGDTDGDLRLESGETGNIFFTLYNSPNWAAAENCIVEVVSRDPNITVNSPPFDLGTILPGDSVRNTSNPVSVTLGQIPDAYWGSLTVVVTGDAGFTIEKEMVLRIGRPQTLLVADDGTGNFYTYFASGMLDSTGGYNFDLWQVAQQGVPTAGTISDYAHVVWVCGNDSVNTLTAADQTMLAQYLDAGGKLIVAGQGIDNDPNVQGTAFYANYLHAERLDGYGGRWVLGAATDPIARGDSLFLQGGSCGSNGTVSPSRINPVNGGIAFFNYRASDGGHPCAVRFENGTYKVAYFAFALEAACGLNRSVHHRVILRRTMEWFGATDAEEVVPVSVPDGFALNPCYPNPFNPTTTISFDVPYRTNVKVTVFDMLGRQVARLVNGRVSAGHHEVSFDGTDLASGVYLVHLRADHYSATRRMLLLK